MAHMLKGILKEFLTHEEATKIYSAFDMIGDIVIIRIPESLNQKKN
jgi:tRNA (guanine37-N1)-methyltransferase